MEAECIEVGGRPDSVADAHRLHRSMHDALVQRLEVGRHLRDALGHVEHRVIELLGRERSVREPSGHGVVARHRVARQHRLHGAAHAHEPRLPCHVGRRHEAHRRVADLRVVRRRRRGRSADASSVPPARQKPCTCAMSGVDMSHISNQPWTTWRAHPPSAPGHRPGQGFGRILREVVAGREARARATDHDGVDRSRTRRPRAAWAKSSPGARRQRVALVSAGSASTAVPRDEGRRRSRGGRPRRERRSWLRDRHRATFTGAQHAPH